MYTVNCAIPIKGSHIEIVKSANKDETSNYLAFAQVEVFGVTCKLSDPDAIVSSIPKDSLGNVDTDNIYPVCLQNPSSSSVYGDYVS